MVKCLSLGLVWVWWYNWMLFLSFFSFPIWTFHWSRCFLAFYNLVKLHLDLTFWGSWSNFLDTYPIKILLEIFYTRVLVMGTLFRAISPLMRPTRWLQCIWCRGDDHFVLPFSFLPCSIPSYLCLPLDCTMLLLTLSFAFPRIGRCP